MAGNPRTQATSQDTIIRNYQLLSPVPTAEAPLRPNPIYQNTLKPTFVLTKDASVEIERFLNNTMMFAEKFFMLSSNPSPRNSDS